MHRRTHLGSIDQGEVASLYRYPVKGLSAQGEDRLKVHGSGLDNDRRFALALGTTSFDCANPAPLDKGFFLMLRRNETLAALRTRFDCGTEVLAIHGPDGTDVRARIDDPSGRATIEEFFLHYLGDDCRGQPRLVEASGHKFTDVSVVSPAMMRALSLINLASVRDLASTCERSLDPLRFRANIYIDGLAPWAELEWVGRSVSIGSALFRCVLRTQRCAAVDVDPKTGLRDTNLPKSLMQTYGHADCGVYLEVVREGSFTLGDPLRLADPH